MDLLMSVYQLVFVVWCISPNIVQYKIYTFIFRSVKQIPTSWLSRTGLNVIYRTTEMARRSILIGQWQKLLEVWIYLLSSLFIPGSITFYVFHCLSLITVKLQGKCWITKKSRKSFWAFLCTDNLGHNWLRLYFRIQNLYRINSMSNHVALLKPPLPQLDVELVSSW
jgi:hypothetical protein